MAANTYDLLREHIGHDIVCVCYGVDDEDPDNIAIECETCNAVLFDLHKDEHYEKFVPPSVEVVETDNSIHYDEEQLPIDADKVLKQIEDSIPPGQKVIVVSTPAPNPNPLFEEAQQAGLVGKVETWKAHPDKIPSKVFELKNALPGFTLVAAGPPRAVVTKAEFDREYLTEFLKNPDTRTLLDTPDRRERLKGHLAKTTTVGTEILMEAIAQKEDDEFRTLVEQCVPPKPETPEGFKKRIESYPLKPDGPVFMSREELRDLATWTRDSGLFNNCPDCGCAEPTNIDGKYEFDELLYTWWCKSCGHSETRSTCNMLIAMVAQADAVVMAKRQDGTTEPIAFTEEALRETAAQNPERLYYSPQTKSLWAKVDPPEGVVIEKLQFNRNTGMFSMGTKTGRFQTQTPNESQPPQPAQDPVFKDEENGLWFFWDEVWADRLGPYETEEDARASLKEYCETHLKAKE